MTHLHITAWVIAFVLFFIVSNGYRNGNEKMAKILHMILRLAYILILVPGILLVMDYLKLENPAGSLMGELAVKVIAGLWAIVAMEMVSVGAKKGRSTKGWVISFFIAAIIAIFLGFVRLPMGI